MAYIAGVLTPVPADAHAAFTAFADAAAPIFSDFGATRVVDAWGDDLPAGKINDFRTAVQATAEETVSFGWMEYADKAGYLAAGEKMRTDPRMQALGPMPFDGKRMIFGGFEIVFDRGTSGLGRYLEGFVLPVPTGNKAAYVEAADQGYAVFADYGVLRHVEAWGDHVPRGQLTDFYRAAHAEDGETIVFSWLEWTDRAARDAAQAKIMADERMEAMAATMPFDGKRMVYGGFEVVSDH